MLTLSFDEVQAALVAVDAPVAAAEAHGTLCGTLVTDGNHTASGWLADLHPAAATGDDALRSRNLLETVFEETRAALGGLDLEFEPLLPDEDAPLAARVDALAAWCGGFLYGFGLREGVVTEALPDEVSELLKDFGEISRATVDRGEPEESSEASYTELVEYLRAGTQLAYEELAGRREHAVDR
jgi:uncharacterized protein YgfB (UPF0149 family)